jgi:hypothetical protein
MPLLNSHPSLREALAAAAVLAGLPGCAGSPAHDILGSYFPSWMICALLGLILAIGVRRILIAANVDEFVPAPVLVYLIMAVAFAFALWLIWLS